MRRRTHTVHVYCPKCPQQFHVFVYGNDPAHVKGSLARSDLGLRILSEHSRDQNITPCENPEGLMMWLERVQQTREEAEELRRGRSKER